MAGYIAVDLDGTLARYDGWKGPSHIGDPIPMMVDAVKQKLAEGWEVKIFTARAWRGDPEEIKFIQDWAEEHLGHRLEVTATKDYGMVELWDDRAKQVIPNTGIFLEDCLPERNNDVHILRGLGWD